MFAHSVRVAGCHGNSLHLREWSSEGAPLLFLHGFGHDSHVWDAFAPEVAKYFRTLTLDTRGHGDSDPDPEFRYNGAAIAGDIEAVLDQLDLERAVLVAHSMTGLASIRLAAMHPERVSRLVLVEASPQLWSTSRVSTKRQMGETSYGDVQEYARVLERAYPRVDAGTLARLAGHWLRRREDGRLVPKLDPTFLRPRSSRDPANRRNFDQKRWAREESVRLWKLVAEIRCPTLVVYGEDSPIVSRETAIRMVNEVLTDGRAVGIPGAGHIVMLEAPDLFRVALMEFLRRDPHP